MARVVERAGWAGCGRGECKALGDWLVACALEINQLSTVTSEVVETAREALIIGS